MSCSTPVACTCDHFPPFSLVVAAVPEAERYVSLLREVAERTGRLVAHWQSLGFVHGQ